MSLKAQDMPHFYFFFCSVISTAGYPSNIAIRRRLS
jgi:hypothetical protein